MTSKQATTATQAPAKTFDAPETEPRIVKGRSRAASQFCFSD